MTLVLFSYFAAVIVVTAVLVVGLRKPIHSAVSLLVMFFHVAGLYVLLNAEFIAVVQILVYAGAILVLYLFVVMLLDVREEEQYHKQRRLGLLIGAALIVEAGLILMRSGIGDEGVETMKAVEPGTGNTEAIGSVLYTTYLFPFEVASLILLVAMIGSIIFAKKGIFDR